MNKSWFTVCCGYSFARKEVGGSRWEHGGVGKMNSYRGAKDLNKGNSEQRKAGAQNAKKGGRSQPLQRGNSDKNLGIESKQLGVTLKTSDESLPSQNGVKPRDKDQILADTKEKGNKKLQREHRETAIVPDSSSVDKMSVMKAKVIEKASSKVIWRKKGTKTDTSDSESKFDVTHTDTLSKSEVKKNAGDRKFDVVAGNVGEKAPSKDIKSRDLIAQKGNVKPSRELQTEIKKESPKQTNRIDPELFKTRSKSTPETSNVQLTESFSNNLNSNSSYSNSSQNSQSGVHTREKDSNSSHSKVKCDPSVHLWLRRLALLEEDKYIDMFARNEIDISVLVTLDEKQLEKMGVLALGAMKKLLAGIEELKQQEKKYKVSLQAYTEKSSPNTIVTDSVQSRASNKSVKNDGDIKTNKSVEGLSIKDSVKLVPSDNSTDSKDNSQEQVSIKLGASVKRSNSMRPQSDAKSSSQQTSGSESQKGSQNNDKTSSRPKDSVSTRSKPSKGVLIAERPQSAKVKNKKTKSGPNLPRAKSADLSNKRATELANKKAEEGMVILID